jgi:arylformamidase
VPAQTPEFVEAEYNARAAVPEHQQFFDRWMKDSEYARRTLEARLDLAYGSDPLQALDIFPAKDPHGTLVFIHGGYWRSLDKSDFSWLAPTFVAAGIGVVVVNYRLCPQVHIDEIVADVLASMRWIHANGTRQRLATNKVVLSGHSAGGHLVAEIFAAADDVRGLTARNIAGGVALSGIFDLKPLLHFSGNADFDLDMVTAGLLSPANRRPDLECPLVVGVGGEESGEFRRQSDLLAKAWPGVARPAAVLPGLHHFSIVDALAERGQPLHDAVLGMLA